MSETLEQIVRRVAIARGVLLFDGRSQDLIELVKEVVAELTKGQEPVAWITGGDCYENGHIDCVAWQTGEFTTPLYAAPPICPTAEWQLVPKEPFNEALDILKKVRDGKISNCVAYQEIIAAAPEYKP